MALKFFEIEFKDLANYKFIRNDVRFFIGQRTRFLNKGIRLGKIFETGRGRVINKEYVQENSGEYPLYSSQTQDEGIFGYIDTYDFDGEYLTWTTDGANAGRVFYRNGKFNCTNVCGIAKVKENNQFDVNLKFLSYFLNTITKYYVSVASGNPKLMNNVFEEIKIPKIPKSIQDQAVAEIEPIEQKIKELKNQIKQPQEIINKVFAREFGFDENLYNEFGKGMTAGTQIAQNRKLRVFETDFKDFARSSILRFSTRFHNPPTKEFMDFTDNIKTLKVKDIITEPIHRGTNPKYDPNEEIPVIKTGHLKNGYIEISEEEFVSEEFYKQKERSQVKKNDVLLASTGKVSLGKIDLVETDEKLVVDGHISIIRINTKKYNPLFFTYFFRSILGYFQIERDYTGATNQIELYANEIEQFLIPDIPLLEQERIVNEIKAELDKQKEIEEEIKKLRIKIDKIIEELIS